MRMLKVILVFLLIPSVAWGDIYLDELWDMSLEELAHIEVSSVTGVEQSFWTSPASVHVISKKDINTSGHLWLPELFRTVPGMNVAVSGSNSWQVSVREGQNELSGKLQILSDDRSLYSSFFSGTQWGIINLFPEDIQRIEVIKGPGAVLWGANAVNGVVNIVSESARNTLGLYSSVVAGSHEKPQINLRYGDSVGANSYYRIWSSYYENTNLSNPNIERDNEWNSTSAGFRSDTYFYENLLLTLEAAGKKVDDIEQFTRGSNFNFSTEDELASGFLRIRLERDKPDETGGWKLQFDYSFEEEDDGRSLTLGFPQPGLVSEYEGPYVKEQRYNIDYRQFWTLGNHQLMWGGQYNFLKVNAISSRFQVSGQPETSIVGFEDPNDDMSLYSFFLQDSITLKPDQWFLMLGSKVEHNAFTGVEIQPNIRLWWTPEDRLTWWSSISRAIRRPTIVEQTIAVGGIKIGNPDLQAEELVALETGLRFKLDSMIYMDLSLYNNNYTHLVSASGQGKPLENIDEVHSYGGEVSFVRDNHEDWRHHLFFSYLESELSDAQGQNVQNRSSELQSSLLSNFSISQNISLNSGLYYTYSSEKNENTEYTRLDLGMTYTGINGWTAEVWGQNLLDKSHIEFEPAVSDSSALVERGFYCKLSYQF